MDISRGRFPAMLACGMLAAGLAGAQDAVIYKSVDKNGNVTYSQEKPADASGQAVTGISVPTLSPEQQRAANRTLLEMEKREDAQYEAKKKKQKAGDARVDAALRRLQQAEQRLAQGSQVRAGDRVANVDGYSRLRGSYFDRVARLEAAVTQAKKDLDAAYAARG